jgi:hypothetical protein
VSGMKTGGRAGPPPVLASTYQKGQFPGAGEMSIRNGPSTGPRGRSPELELRGSLVPGYVNVSISRVDEGFTGLVHRAVHVGSSPL